MKTYKVIHPAGNFIVVTDVTYQDAVRQFGSLAKLETINYDQAMVLVNKERWLLVIA
jgi:non-homologous end joining protein Ku